MASPQRSDSSAVISVVAYVHLEVKERILSGVLAPGDALLQEHLAEDLKVSRAPVREALKLLVAEGLIIFRPRRGYLVTDLNAAEIDEIFDIRAMLEGRAAHLAAKKRSESDVQEVRGLLDAMKRIKIRTSEDLAHWARVNREFHARVFAASGRNHLSKMANMLRDAVERYVRIDAATPGRIKEATAEHEAIFRAFESGNASLCEKLTREHCAHTCARLISTLQSHGGRK